MIYRYIYKYLSNEQLNLIFKYIKTQKLINITNQDSNTHIILCICQMNN